MPLLAGFINLDHDLGSIILILNILGEKRVPDAALVYMKVSYKRN